MLWVKWPQILSLYVLYLYFKKIPGNVLDPRGSHVCLKFVTVPTKRGRLCLP